MSKNEHHVVPNTSRGGWDVKRNGAQKASIHTETKVEAVKIGRVMSQRAGSELVIHGKDGRIQQKDSHGNDPCPPRDKN
ncbi:MAG: DUF2188 domain-containing protein [Clostridia bacterium]|nr:DUF2188 domain-containing protein [Clostridia bacterium]